MSHHRRNRVRAVEMPAAEPIWASSSTNNGKTGEPVANLRHSRTPATEETIRLCAYFKWESAGRPQGDGVEFWLEARKQLEEKT